MKIDKNQSSEFGDFKLMPEDGNKLNIFIDYTSKLIIVSEYPIDISNLPSRYGITELPSKQFVVDPTFEKNTKS